MLELLTEQHIGNVKVFVQCRTGDDVTSAQCEELSQLVEAPPFHDRYLYVDGKTLWE